MASRLLVFDAGTDDEVVFECVEIDEATQLFFEIFKFRVYDRFAMLERAMTSAATAIRRAIVFDVGANIGLFAMRCLRNYTKCTLYAFEPAPIVLPALRRNLINDSDDDNNNTFEVVPCAVRDVVAKATPFYVLPRCWLW